MTKSEPLRSMIKAEWPQHVRSTSARALAAVDEIGSRKASLDPQALRQHVANHGGPATVRAEQELSRARHKLVSDRLGLQEKALQHSSPRDAAMAAEIRAHIRSLPHGDRLKILMGKDANIHAQRAVLEAPEFLTGVPADIQHRIMDQILESQFPTEVAEFAHSEEAIDHAAAAVRLAKDELARVVDFDKPGDFEKFYATIKPAA